MMLEWLVHSIYDIKGVATKNIKEISIKYNSDWILFSTWNVVVQTNIQSQLKIKFLLFKLIGSTVKIYDVIFGCNVRLEHRKSTFYNMIYIYITLV